MKRFFLPAFLALSVVMRNEASTDDTGDAKPQAGWMGVFTQYQNYEPTFQKPVIESVKPPVYRQTARYDWLGGRLEAVEITLARDPKFAKVYAELLSRGDNPPKALKVGKFMAWQWKSAKLVVILGPDRIVQVESKTPEHHDSDLVGFAKKMDLEKCAKALEQPPRVPK